eukprot:271109_1
MGIRGLYILHHEGKYYRVYNHNNSYYHGLGKKLLVELNNTYHKDKKLTKWTSKIKELQSVIVKKNIDHTLHAELVEKWNLHKLKRARDNGGILLEGPYYRNKLEFHINPSDEEVKRLRKYTDLTNAQHDKEWYCLLKKCQGSFEKVLDAGYILYEIESSLKKIMKQAVQGCYIDIEYFYILDFDTSEFRYMSPQHDLIMLNDYCKGKLHSTWNVIKLSQINDKSKWPVYLYAPVQCIHEAIKYQLHGNKLFKLTDSNFAGTIKIYKMSLKWVKKIEELFGEDVNKHILKKIKEINVSINYKLGVIYYKLNNCKYSAKHCSLVLKLDSSHVGALILIAKCRIQQCLFKSATKYLKKAKHFGKFENNNDAIKELMNVICSKRLLHKNKDKLKIEKICDWCGVKGLHKRVIVNDTKNYCVEWYGDMENEKPLRRCSVCSDVLYCGIRCQKFAWKIHRLVCAKIML